MTMPALRILIADDHPAVRRSLRALLESRAQWIVCAEAVDGEEAVEQAARLRPDVALLDFEMPKLNGLAAAQQIRARAPAVQVLVLTMHDSMPLREDARRAGARAVVVKSDAGASLLAAIESLCVPDMAVVLAGSVVREQRHIAAFFHSEGERYRVLAPFIADGLACGEKAVHLVDPPDLHVQRLAEVGVDARPAEARHQLELVPWSEAYLRGGHFDPEAMTARIHELLGRGKAEGYPLTRLVAHMEWALGGWPGVDRLVEYEARLNDAFAGCTDVVICVYDLTRFAGHVIIDVLRGHPLVIIGGTLRENPFYTPPAAMIEELRSRELGH
jgi:DNA-binding NarL/FixJ family response regulator